MPFCFIKLQLRCLDCTLADILTSSHETMGMSRPRCHVWWQSLCGSASDPSCVGFYSFPTQLPPENLRSEYLYGCFSTSCWQLREVRVPQKVAGSHEKSGNPCLNQIQLVEATCPWILGVNQWAGQSVQSSYQVRDLRYFGVWNAGNRSFVARLEIYQVIVPRIYYI